VVRLLSCALDGLGRCFALLPSPASRTVLVLLIVVVAAAFVQSCDDAITFGGVDLRARVIGARAMFAGLNPYFYEQNVETPERLADPFRSSRIITRCTYPPTLLCAYGALAWLPYKAQRLIWFVLEWSLLFASVALLARLIRPQRVRLLFVSVALLFFAAGYFWRLHVERGQYYVLVVFLWSAGAFVCLKLRRHSAWGGILFGCAAAMRPTALVVIGPLWLLGLRRTAYTTLLTAAVLCLVTVPVSGIGGWTEFARMTEMHAQAEVSPGLLYTQGGPEATRSGAVVEGYDLTQMLDARTTNTALLPLVSALWRSRPWLPRVSLPLLVKVAACAFLAVAGLGLLLTRRERYVARDALALAFLASLWIDYFVPIRYGYADVQFLAPIALVMPAALKTTHRAAFTLIVLGLAFGHVLTYLDGRWATWLRTVGVVGGLTVYAARVWVRRTRPGGSARRR